MGRKPLPIHETASRDRIFLRSLNDRIRKVDSKFITDEDRAKVTAACQTLVDILDGVHKAYYGM